MPNTIESKYYLKSIHAEIDLFDRRLAHLLKYDVFDTDAPAPPPPASWL